MDPERRGSVRIKRSLDLQYLTTGNAESPVWVSGILRDVSETGISFTSDKNFLPHQVINIRIRFPTSPFQWIEMEGVCIGSRGLSIGIYIIRLELKGSQENQKKAIKDYLAWVLRAEQEKR